MRFLSSVLSVAVLAGAAVAAPTPLGAQATLATLEREVASLLPALRSDNPSAQLPTAAALVTVLEQAASDIVNDAQGFTGALTSFIDDMTVAVHDALGSHGAPFADSIDSALDRLLRATSIAPDEMPATHASSPHDLVLQPAA